MKDIKRQIWSDGSIVYQEKQSKCCSNTVKVLDKDLIIHQLYEIILEQQKQIKNLEESFNKLKTSKVSVAELKDLQKELYKTKYKNLSDLLESTEKYKIWNSQNIYRFIWKDYLHEHFNSKFPSVKISCGDEYVYVEVKRSTFTDNYSVTAVDKPLIQIIEEIEACIDKNIME